MNRPLLIGIGGSRSGAGKTTVAVALLKYLTGHASRINSLLHRMGRHGHGWGAIKYTKTAFHTSITDDISILNQKDKDTRRFIDAGAKEVLWVQSPAKELLKILLSAVGRLSSLDAIIIEGNSAIEFLKPDIVIFINAVDKTVKATSRAIQRQADIVITANDDKKPSAGRFNSYCLHIDPFALDDQAVMKIIYCMEKVAIKELLQKKYADGALTCESARELADSIGMPYMELGKLADELKIKIKNCELGCF